jgi:magnesium-transporting ATPase (P-type)
VLKTGTNTGIQKAQAVVLSDKAVRVVSVFQVGIMRLVQIFVICSIILVVAVLMVIGVAYQGFENDWQGIILAAFSILIVSIPVFRQGNKQSSTLTARIL